jgi:ribonucleoside-diphosphate reductase alpha chain
MYSYQEVYESTLKYFRGDKLATDVWINKYALKDQEGNIHEKNPDDMHRRLSKELARIESNYPNPMSEQEIYELLKDFKYVVPQGSPMFGIGNNFSITSLSNCFVIGSNGNSDSYGSIFRTDEEQVQLMKRRGGVGHDISHLRPSGAVANNSILKGISGSTLYMERYSNSTREVSQGDRRGALMLSMDIRHPDVEKFIDRKLEEGKVTGANISVRITDEFMNCVKNNTDFWQCFPIDMKIPLGKEYDDIVSNLKLMLREFGIK